MKKPVVWTHRKTAEYFQISEMVIFLTKMHFNLLVRFVGRHLSDTTLKLGRSTIEPLHMNLYAIKLYDQAESAEGPKILREPSLFY